MSFIFRSFLKTFLEALANTGFSSADAVLILGVFIMIYTGVSFLPAAGVYYFMNKKNDRFEGNFSYTYFGTWGGGFLFMILFILWFEFFFPIAGIIGFFTTFFAWLLIGCVAGGLMGYTFLAKLRREPDVDSEEPEAPKSPKTEEKKSTIRSTIKKTTEAKKSTTKKTAPKKKPPGKKEE